MTGRLGLALDREKNWTSEMEELRRLKTYGIANLYYEFLDETEITITNVTLENRPDRFWAVWV